MTPLKYNNDCSCHYNQSYRSNVFRCFGLYVLRLPDVVPKYTNWMLFDNTNIRQLCGNNHSYTYLLRPSNVTYISLRHSNIQRICLEILKIILHNSSVKWLDLSFNKLAHLSHEFSSMNMIEKLYLEGNPIYCFCGMAWMTQWIRVSNYVQHKAAISCVQGLEIGKPIYTLDMQAMGCPPSTPGIWVVIISVVGFLMAIVLISAMVVYCLDFRWLVYRNLGILVGNPDENEDIEALQFDAFLSYW